MTPANNYAYRRRCCRDDGARTPRRQHVETQRQHLQRSCSVTFCQPLYWLGHPDNCSFLLYNSNFGSSVRVGFTFKHFVSLTQSHLFVSFTHLASLTVTSLCVVNTVGFTDTVTSPYIESLGIKKTIHWSEDSCKRKFVWPDPTVSGVQIPFVVRKVCYQCSCFQN